MFSHEHTASWPSESPNIFQIIILCTVDSWSETCLSSSSQANKCKGILMMNLQHHSLLAAGVPFSVLCHNESCQYSLWNIRAELLKRRIMKGWITLKFVILSRKARNLVFSHTRLSLNPFHLWGHWSNQGRVFPKRLFVVYQDFATECRNYCPITSISPKYLRANDQSKRKKPLLFVFTQNTVFVSNLINRAIVATGEKIRNLSSRNQRLVNYYSFLLRRS